MPSPWQATAVLSHTLESIDSPETEIFFAEHEKFERLGLIASSKRFLFLAELGVCPCLVSSNLAAKARRLRAVCEKAFWRPFLLVDMTAENSKFRGSIQKAVG